MDKQQIVGLIIARLEAEFLRYADAARDAQAGATDEQSRSENKYDTRGLEASYLAHGQSVQALEAGRARDLFVALAGSVSDPDQPIGIGTLVSLDDDGEEQWYFVGPAAGGTEVTSQGIEVLVITPKSPLYQVIVGKRIGERAKMVRGSSADFLIKAVY